MILEGLKIQVHKKNLFLKFSELKNFNFCNLKVMKIYFCDLQDVKLNFFRILANFNAPKMEIFAYRALAGKTNIPRITKIFMACRF